MTINIHILSQETLRPNDTKSAIILRKLFYIPTLSILRYKRVFWCYAWNL